MAGTHLSRCPNRENCFLTSMNGWLGENSSHTRAPQAAAVVHAPRIMSGDKATARSRELLAVEHNDAAASHPATLLLGGERGAPSPSPSPAKKNGGANEHPTAARTKPDFSELPPPPSALLAKLNAFMPEMRRANAELEEAMKTRPAGDFDIEHVSGSGSDSDSESDSDTDDASEDGRTGLDPESAEYKVRAAIRGIEAQQRKDAKTRAKRKGEGGGGGGGGGKQVIEMNVGLGVVDLATEQAVARAKELAGDAVVGEDASSEDTRESGGRIRLPGQVHDAGRRAGIQELS